jgi:hypothetical protein
MDRVHHQLQDRIDETPGCLRVEVFNEGGGVLDVTKDSSDDPALALGQTTGFQGGLRGPDIFSQMQGRVANGGLKARV